MTARLAIHDRAGSFSNRWIAFCDAEGTDYEIVNGYETDIITKLADFDGFMWHFDHQSPTDLLMSRNVLMSAEQMGLVVFPSTPTCWHFDDKLAQKYLLEAIGAPMAPTWAFFSKDEALAWLREAEYPLVTKLRRGAGSYNVRLLRDYGEAARRCDAAFGKGINAVPGYFADARTKLRKVANWGVFWGKVKRIPRLMLRQWTTGKQMPREKGYVLFQKFIPDATSDTRVNIVGNRAWAQIRQVRPGDFRASGSGALSGDPSQVDMECVRIAFRVAEAIGSQSMAFDLVIDPAGVPWITEISYGYGTLLIYEFGGFWDRDLRWHAGSMRAEDGMVIDVLAEIEKRKGSAGVDSR